MISRHSNSQPVHHIAKSASEMPGRSGGKRAAEPIQDNYVPQSPFAAVEPEQISGRSYLMTGRQELADLHEYEQNLARADQRSMRSVMAKLAAKDGSPEDMNPASGLIQTADASLKLAANGSPEYFRTTKCYSPLSLSGFKAV